MAEKSFFIIGGTNVALLQVGQKLGPYYRWHKCCIDTKVMVALTSLALTLVAKTLVAKTSVGKMSRHRKITLKFSNLIYIWTVSNLFS